MIIHPRSSIDLTAVKLYLERKEQGKGWRFLYDLVHLKGAMAVRVLELGADVEYKRQGDAGQLLVVLIV